MDQAPETMPALPAETINAALQNEITELKKELIEATTSYARSFRTLEQLTGHVLAVVRDAKPATTKGGKKQVMVCQPFEFLQMKNYAGAVAEALRPQKEPGALETTP